MTAIIPVNITFKEWAAQLRNTFPTQDFSRVSSENDWKQFSIMLKCNRCFENKFIPDSNSFPDWRSWASQFLLSVGV